MSKKVKIFAIVVIILAVGIWAISAFSGSSTPDPIAPMPGAMSVTPVVPGSPLSTSIPMGVAVPSTMGPSVSTGSDFAMLLSSINTITIDTSLFENPGYKALRDFPIDLGTDIIGRTNPFAPIGSDQGQGVSTETAGKPEIQTIQPGKITATTAELGAIVTLRDAMPVSVILQYGINDMFSSSTSPIILTKSGTALTTVTGLQPNTLYYVRSVAVQGSTINGETVTFTTLPAPSR